MLECIKIKKTCEALPAQWEGELSDGRMIYVRYRWGGLTVSVSRDKTNDIGEAVGGPEMMFKQLDPDGWCGEMGYEELITLTKDLIKWPPAERTN
tara:strand:+ start:1808 stop:2092 length:285 start_codon:yes stop_codon:yes gene_type:complete